jgi:hypothetical protein
MPRPEISATLQALAACFGSAAFTSAQAQESGVAHHRLLTAQRSGGLMRLERGRYQLSAEVTVAAQAASHGCRDGAADGVLVPGLSEEETARVRDRVARLAADGVSAGISSTTAAAVWELPTYGIPASRLPVLLIPRGSSIRPGQHAGIHITHRDVDPARLVLGPGTAPVTDPLLTAIHIAAGPRLSLAAQLVVLHGGLRRQWEWVTGGLDRLGGREVAAAMGDPLVRASLREELQAVAQCADLRDRGSRGSTHPEARRAWRRLAHALDIVDPRVETALESLSWARFHEGDFVIPVPQVLVRGASGMLWRVDFLFQGRVIGECDGAVKYNSGHTPWKEKQRQSDLEAEGYPVVRWTWDEIHRRPQRVLDRISLAIDRHC